MNVTAGYDGETGRSGYYKATKGHKADTEKKKIEGRVCEFLFKFS